MRSPKPSARGPWLDASSAAAYLALPSVEALYKMVRRGTLAGCRLGRLLRFSQPALDALLTAKGTSCLDYPPTPLTAGGGGR